MRLSLGILFGRVGLCTLIIYDICTGGQSSGVHGVLVVGQNGGQLSADQTGACRRIRENPERGQHERTVRRRAAVL